jgi:DNA replication protein DnaC
MNTGRKELQSILEELDELKLPNMAAELQERYKQPDFINLGRLELVSAIVHAEYNVTMNNRYITRLKKAKLRGSSCCLDNCKDSEQRQYQPAGIVSTLATLDFIRNGMNLCVFGPSDSGKTYMAKALGTEACRDFRVAYYHCDELTGELAAIRK